MECMQIISRKCPERFVRGCRHRQQQQHQTVLMVLVFVLPMRLTWATVRILLSAVKILAEELRATWRNMVSERL